MVRHFSYGIRERRYSLHAFEARFGSSPHDVFGPEIEWMVAEKLVDATADHLELTLQGVLRLGDIEEARRVALVALLLAWWVHAQSPRDGGATHRVRACPPCELPRVSTVRGRSQTPPDP